MNTFRRNHSLAALACIAFSAMTLGASLEGIWKGKFSYDYSKLPSTLTAEQKKKVIELSKKRTGSTVTLTLKANHSFTLKADGVGATAKPVNGQWGSDAKSVTLQPQKDGKKDAAISFNLLDGGKKLVFSNGPLTMTFTR